MIPSHAESRGTRQHRILFLYSELAGYFLACAEELGKHPEVEEVTIVHLPVNPEAPFQLASSESYSLVPKATLGEGLPAFVREFRPTALVCSGWMDADYNRIAREWCPRIPVVLTLDNWWTGSWKQRVAVWTSPWYIQRHFNRAWVPGAPQKSFAEKLGFTGNRLATGFYCADARPFQRVWEERQLRTPAKKILYIGRYLDVKGVRELWVAFSSLSDIYPDWELHCIGTGDLWDQRKIHPQIVHHGFKQPHELHPHLVDAACFVMPSKAEPWGVVLHEMAIAGLPLLASDRVGAATAFLHDGENGFRFRPSGITTALGTFMDRFEPDNKVFDAKSHGLGSHHNAVRWMASLFSILPGQVYEEIA
jgi:glycosyltransferase involved in cell wall biosynthesis